MNEPLDIIASAAKMPEACLNAPRAIDAASGASGALGAIEAVPRGSGGSSASRAVNAESGESGEFGESGASGESGESGASRPSRAMLAVLKEQRTVKEMLLLYCKALHKDLRLVAPAESDSGVKSAKKSAKKLGRDELCEQCAALLDYANMRVEKCPHLKKIAACDGDVESRKPFCSNCTIHCYAKDMREKMRAVMRYSGPRMLIHHPVLALRHLAESRKSF